MVMARAWPNSWALAGVGLAEERERMFSEDLSSNNTPVSQATVRKSQRYRQLAEKYAHTHWHIAK